MKKLIIIIIAIVLLFLAFLLFYFIPENFHQGIHENLIKSRYQESQITYAKNSFHERSSLIVIDPKTQLKIRTNTSINPLDNVINVDYLNSEIDLAINFQIYFHLRGLSAIAIEIKFSDEDFIRDANFVKFRNLSLFIEKVTLADLNHLTNGYLSQALENKKLFIKLANADLKIDEVTGSLENLDLKIGNTTDGEKLTFEFSTEIDKLISSGLSKELNLEKSLLSLSLASFEKNLALEFISTVPARSAVRRAPPSIFEVLPYIKAIRYPLEFKLRANAIDDGSDAYLTLDAALTSQKFLSLKSYTAEFESQNKTAATLALLKEAILYAYPKGAARNYMLAKDTPLDQRFMQRDEVRAKIKSVIYDDLLLKEEELLRTAVEMNLLQKQDNLFKIRVQLKEGNLTINENSYELKQAMGLPVKLLENTYAKSNSDISNLLISKGLHPTSR